MCFSYAVNFDKEALQSRLQLGDFSVPDQGYFFSAFTYPVLPIIVSENNRLSAKASHWGLIPGWCKSQGQADEIKKLGFNARGETMNIKPMFRFAFEHNRCLIPASGFFEWRQFNKKKYPYFIQPASGDCFLFAGLAEKWVNRETGEEISTYCIVTCGANALMASIHNTKLRMPFILTNENIKPWLTGGPEEAMELVKPVPDQYIKAFTVSKLVSTASADRNVPEVQREFLYPEIEQNPFL